MRTLLLILVLSAWACNTFAQNGINLFNDNILHRIEISNVDTIKTLDPAFRNVYQNVSIKIDGNVYSSVGLSTKGDKSFIAAPNGKKPFKVKMNKYIPETKYDGIMRFNLNNGLYDNSFIREKLTFDASAQLGIPSPKIAFTELYIDDKYWGVYTIVEAQDEIYKRFFGNDNGVTMEASGTGLPVNTLQYYGPNESDYGGLYTFDKGDPLIAWPLWITTLDKLNNTPDGNNYIDLTSPYFDFASFFKFNAVLDYNMNAEDKGRNGIYYRDATTAKFYTICWDQNVAFPDSFDPALGSFIVTYKIAILNKYAQYSQFSDYYNGAICTLSQTIFTPTSLSAKMTLLRGIIDDAVRRDYRKGFDFATYETSFTNLINFINTRNIKSSAFLASANYTCNPMGINTINKGNFTIYPNPSDD
jgi:hypothetical protein